MRVISGSARGIALKAPPGTDTRPTTDRIKENIFNLIQNDIHATTVLDLFSGSGALAIEALSRGAKQAVMVDSSKKCYNIINENLNKTKLLDKAQIMQMDVGSAMRIMKTQGIVFDLIFMDPPYHQGWPQQMIELIEALQLLSEDAVVVVEHEAALEMPEQYSSLVKYKERTYGQIAVTIYRGRSSQ